MGLPDGAGECRSVPETASRLQCEAPLGALSFSLTQHKMLLHDLWRCPWKKKDVLGQEMPEDEMRFENLLPRQGVLCPTEKARELCKGVGSTHGSREGHLGVAGEAMLLFLSFIMGQRSTPQPLVAVWGVPDPADSHRAVRRPKWTRSTLAHWLGIGNSCQVWEEAHPDSARPSFRESTSY